MAINLNCEMNKGSPSPKKKVARFSQHFQVFQYSKKKGQSDLENDSLLLDPEEIHQVESNVCSSNKQPRPRSQEKLRNIQIIEAETLQLQKFLQEETMPQIRRVSEKLFLPKKQDEGANERSQSYGMANEVNFGRNTMNCEEQILLKSNLKNIPKEASSKKKKLPTIMSPQEIRDKFEKEVENKRRITMDVLALRKMFEDYGQQEREREKTKRSSRVTLDVFALTKLMEQEAKEEEPQPENKNLTPIKEYEGVESFSTHKKKSLSAHEKQIQILKYESRVEQTTQKAQQKNQQLREELLETENRVLYLKKRTDDLKAENEAKMQELFETEKLISEINYDIVQCTSSETEDYLHQFSSRHGIIPIKYSQPYHHQPGMAYFILQGLLIKLKKFRNKPSQIKIIPDSTSSRWLEAKQTFFSCETLIKILKKYHFGYLKEKQNLIEVILSLHSFYLNLLDLGEQIEDLTQIFSVRGYELSHNFEMFSFRVILEPDEEYLIEMNLVELMDNFIEVNSRTITVYSLKLQKEIDLKTLESIKTLRYRDESILMKVVTGLFSYNLGN